VCGSRSASIKTVGAKSSWSCCVWLRYDRRGAGRDRRICNMAEEILDANAAQRRY
jgi:hypothetical protein